MLVRHRLLAAVTAVSLLLVGSGCASTPSGPSFPGLPGAQAPAGDGGVGDFIGGMMGSCGSLLMGWASLMAKFSSGFTGSQISESDVQQLDQLAAGVPEELRADFKVLGDALRAASGQSTEKMGQILDTPEVKAASDHIEAWVDANCAMPTR